MATSHSGFSARRFHPILKINRPHLGVDYGAPTGTPVLAVGDGTITIAATRGGSGKMISLKHNGTYTTQYKHLSGYAKGIAPGVKVGMGPVIGFVGQTGLATGPHLHYEFHIGDRVVDPQGCSFPRPIRFQPSAVKPFKRPRRKLSPGCRPGAKASSRHRCVITVGSRSEQRGAGYARALTRLLIPKTAPCGSAATVWLLVLGGASRRPPAATTRSLASPTSATAKKLSQCAGILPWRARAASIAATGRAAGVEVVSLNSLLSAYPCASRGARYRKSRQALAPRS